MAASDFNNVAFIMKRLYSEKEPESLAARDRVWLTKVPKRKDFTGLSLTVPLKYGNPQSISTTLPGAQAGVGQTKGAAWIGTRVKRYGDIQVDGESILATGNNKGAFLELLETEVDGTLDEHGRRLSNDLYGNGSGSLGKAAVVSATTNGTVTLTNLDDIKNFAVGQSFGANPNETGNVGTMRAGNAVISAINEDAGQFTFVGTVTGLAVSDFLYNANTTATDYDFGFFGLAAWLPLTAPSATLFMNVDRTQNVNALSGYRLNRQGYSIFENAITLGTRIQRAKGRPDIGLISPSNFAQLVLDFGSKVQYDGAGGDVVGGFESVTIQLPSGKCKFYPDPDCPSDRFYLLTSSTWQLRYLGSGFPHIIMDDGLRSLRTAAQDGIELRTRSLAQLFCTAPGKNGVCAI